MADALGVDRAPLGVDRAPLGVAFTPLVLPPPLRAAAAKLFRAALAGELSLLKSYWVNGLVGGFLVGAAITALNVTVHGRSEAQPVLWLAALIATWVVVSLFTMWQAVGVWRSATNYKAGGKYFWGGLAKTVTVLGILNLAYNCLFVATPQMAGIYEIIDGDARRRAASVQGAGERSGAGIFRRDHLWRRQRTQRLSRRDGRCAHGAAAIRWAAGFSRRSGCRT